jgi:hypothetical protein
MEKKLLKNELDFYKWYFEYSNEEGQLIAWIDERIPKEYPCMVVVTIDADSYSGDLLQYDFIYKSDFKNL